MMQSVPPQPLTASAAVAKKKSDDLKFLEELLLKRGITNNEIEDIIGVGKADMGEVNEKYYEIAMDLSDRGFGSFDRCLHILCLTDGFKTDAERILSRFILKEGK